MMSPTLILPHTLPELQVYGEPHLRTDGHLLALAFAADGTLLSVEEPGCLRRWQPGTGRQLTWHSLSDLETLWAFSRDARVLASASNDLSIWDTSTGRLLTAMAQPSWVTALAFAAEPSCLATGHDDGAVRLWDAAGQRLLRELCGHQRPVSALAFSPQGTMLASAGEDKTICLWNVADGQMIGSWRAHTDRIPALAWHPDGVFLVSAGWDTTARVWDTRSLEPVILLNDHAQQVTALSFSPNGHVLACADSENIIRLWDFDNKKILRRLGEGGGWRVEGGGWRGERGQGSETGARFFGFFQSDIDSLTFSPDGKMLAAAGACLIRLWDSATGQVLAGQVPPGGGQTQGLARFSAGLAVHPGGTTLASSGGGTCVRLWERASRKPLPSLEDQEIVQALAYSPAGNILAQAAGLHVRLWDATSGQAVADLEGPAEPISCLAFAPHGELLATASSAGLSVWLWSLADCEPILLIPDALDGCTIEALSFHPQGRLLAVAGIDSLATGGSDGAVSLWDIQDRCEVATFSGGSLAIAFHPAGQLLASAGVDGSIHLLDLPTQESVAELRGHDGAITCLAYSPDGQWLASGSEDRTVRLWDQNGRQAGLVELDSQVHNLAFAADGQTLFTANANTTCYQMEIRRLLEQSPSSG